MSGNVRSLHPAWREQAKADDGPAPGRFALRAPSSFADPEPPRLVGDFMHHTDLVLVYGGWGSGKSFFVIDLACSLALGDLWRGRACDPGLVVYVAGEAPRSIENRIKAWLRRRFGIRRNAPEPPVRVVGSAPDLLNGETDLDELAAAIELEAKAVNLPVRAIIFDTLHACAPGSKEDAADTGAVLSRVRPLIAKFGCAAILVHHSGKDESRGARGSVSLEAAADLIVKVNENGDLRQPIVEKMRDGELPELEPFKIRGVVFNQGDPNAVSVGVHELTEPKEDPSDPRREKAAKMFADGIPLRAIARTFGIGKSTAERWVKGRSH